MLKYLGYGHNNCTVAISLSITRQTLYNHLSKMQWKVQCFDSVSCFKVGVRNILGLHRSKQ